jgi:hypothetical protein
MLNLINEQKAIRLIGDFNEFISYWYQFSAIIFY